MLTANLGRAPSPINVTGVTIRLRIGNRRFALKLERVYSYRRSEEEGTADCAECADWGRGSQRVGNGADQQEFLELLPESARGLPHYKTLREGLERWRFREVWERVRGCSALSDWRVTGSVENKRRGFAAPPEVKGYAVIPIYRGRDKDGLGARRRPRR